VNDDNNKHQSKHLASLLLYYIIIFKFDKFLANKDCMLTT